MGREQDLYDADVVDLERPNPARMYDYYLGGAYNFAADRALAKQVIAVAPWMREAVRANRAFLARAVRFCVSQGIRQFLDLGSGIPTAGNVHEVAQNLAPESRVAYVDNDAVAYTHSKLLLQDTPNATITRADLTDAESVLTAPTVLEMIDFNKPVAVLAVSVLHFLPDERKPENVLGTYRDSIAPGSYVAMSHGSADHDPTEATGLVAVYQQSTNPLYARTRAEISRMLDGLELVKPGLVDATGWRPDQAPELTQCTEHALFYAAVGRRV